MIRTRAPRPFLLLLAAVLPAGCSGGGPDAGTAALRAKVESQASEIEALKKAAKDMDARARALEERISAAAAASRPAPAAAAAEVTTAPNAIEEHLGEPAKQDVAAFLDTEQGRLKLVEAVEAAEKRRAEKADKEQRDRMVSFVKDRVTGYLTEQLNLDSTQQQAVLAVAVESTEKLGEVWKVMRESRGDPAALATAREKTNEIRQQALDRIQQSLTVDQFNKFQEILNDGGGGLFMGGRGGFGGPPGGGAPGGAGGAGGGGRGGR